MAEPIEFNRSFDDSPGKPSQVSTLVTRVLAPNASPFTFKGTCSYLVGRTSLAVIDPGPADEAHIAALLGAIAARPVTHILVTHTHRDHSPGARLLQERVGGEIYAHGPHQTRPVAGSGSVALDASGDLDFTPDHAVAHGDMIAGEDFQFECVFTPGHTANHMAFALKQERALFSGDHVMGWSTSVIAPPDGDMAAYMSSLRLLSEREDQVYWPGHGGAVVQPNSFVRAFISHRRMRETAIVRRIEAGDRLIAEIVPRIYDGLAPALIPAASLSVLAHLVDLVSRGVIVSEGPPTLTAVYRIA